MQGITTVDTTEQQAFVGPIRIVDMPTRGTSLRGGVGIDAHNYAAIQDGFIGQHAMKFSKRPLRIHAVAFALLHRNTLGSLAILLACVGAPFRALSNMGQLFYADECMWMLLHNPPGYRVVRVCLQPSLSSTDRNQATCRGTSAFFLQTFAQPGVMVGSVPDRLSRMEGRCSLGVGGDGKIANAHIHANDLRVLIWRWIGPLNLKRNEQKVSLVWFIVPELCGANGGSFFQEFDMLIISLVGDHDSAIERQETHLLIDFEAIIFSILVGQGRRNKRRRLVQTFIPLFRVPCVTCGCILFGFGPESFIAGRHLTHDTTGHLGRQHKESTNIQIRPFMQAKSAADLAMFKRIVTDKVERIAIGQLRCAQGGELLRRRVQFEFGRQSLFHRHSLAECSWEHKRKERGTIDNAMHYAVLFLLCAGVFLSSTAVETAWFPERGIL
jgi:hypothetical protein